jgi:hypothetical protein
MTLLNVLSGTSNMGYVFSLLPGFRCLGFLFAEQFSQTALRQNGKNTIPHYKYQRQPSKVNLRTSSWYRKMVTETASLLTVIIVIILVAFVQHKVLLNEHRKEVNEKTNEPCIISRK